MKGTKSHSLSGTPVAFSSLVQTLFKRPRFLPIYEITSYIVVLYFNILSLRLLPTLGGDMCLCKYNLSRQHQVEKWTSLIQYRDDICWKINFVIIQIIHVDLLQLFVLRPAVSKPAVWIVIDIVVRVILPTRMRKSFH